ncbi:MAG: hypothetical protein KAS93_06035 [Gammaproteobacteria bacterium]|nr:hypothetical protein [Gammaproteobacteria bacterium]
MRAILKYKLRFNMLSLRERLMVFVAVFGVLLVLWYFGLWNVLRPKQTESGVTYAQLKPEVASLKKALELSRAKLTTLSGQNAKLAVQAKQHKQGAVTTLSDFLQELISPEKMHAVLKDMLQLQHGLKVISFENVPGKVIGTPGTQYMLYEHGISIKFQGSYLSVLSYLESLENLEWGFYWDNLEYKVTKYPTAEVTLELHTLSNKKDLIHV